MSRVVSPVALVILVSAAIGAAVVMSPHLSASSLPAIPTGTAVPVATAGPRPTVAPTSPQVGPQPAPPVNRKYPVKPPVPANPARVVTLPTPLNTAGIATPLHSLPGGAGPNSATASCLTGVSVSLGNAPGYNDATIPVTPAISTCQSSMVLNFWVLPPGGSWQQIDSRTVQDVRNNGGHFLFTLTNDDNITLQYPSGNYIFDVCSDVCVGTPTTYMNQNPVTSQGNCTVSQVGTPCSWYAKNSNTTGNTTTYDQWSASPYGPNGAGVDQYTDRILSGMLVSSNNIPGNTDERGEQARKLEWLT